MLGAGLLVQLHFIRRQVSEKHELSSTCWDKGESNCWLLFLSGEQHMVLTYRDFNGLFPNCGFSNSGSRKDSFFTISAISLMRIFRVSAFVLILFQAALFAKGSSLLGSCLGLRGFSYFSFSFLLYGVSGTSYFRS